jgi:hypothetical protein
MPRMTVYLPRRTRAPGLNGRHSISDMSDNDNDNAYFEPPCFDDDLAYRYSRAHLRMMVLTWKKPRSDKAFILSEIPLCR